MVYIHREGLKVKGASDIDFCYPAGYRISRILEKKIRFDNRLE